MVRRRSVLFRKSTTTVQKNMYLKYYCFVLVQKSQNEFVVNATRFLNLEYKIEVLQKKCNVINNK